MTKKQQRTYHSERDSPFFRLRSKAKLASLLFISTDKLQKLANTGDDLYFDFSKPKSKGGHRKISAPRQDLKDVQSRIADLLSRIAPPDYLFAPVAGRSYVDNAARHIGADSVRLLDIEDFFPSCTINRAIWFFHKRMECSPDVAAILARIVTLREALPQGSPCSPILAYLTYVDMWDEIQRLVKGEGCVLSVYADDLTISGSIVRENLIWSIKKCLRKFGHRYSRQKERSKHLKPTEITGTILTRSSLRVPNRQRQRIVEIKREISSVSSSKRRCKLEAELRGRQAQLAQVEEHGFHFQI